MIEKLYVKENELTNLSSKPPAYCSYILRCWREHSSDEVGEAETARLRFSLENPHTGERFGFAGPDALVQFLRARVELRDAEVNA